MDHAEVIAWLEEAFFRPGALRTIEQADEADPALAPLREHLAACPSCSAELRSLRATSVALDVGLGPGPAAEQRMLARVRQLGRQRPLAEPARPEPARAEAPSAGGWRAILGRISPLPAAAVLLLVVLAFGSGALLSLNLPQQQPAEGPRLANATAAMGQLLRMPDAHQVWLQDESETPAGLAVYSPSERRLAVIATGIVEPADGNYDCYLQRGQQRMRIGPMFFEGDTAFWAGPMEPVDAGQPGDVLLVMADQPDMPMLSAEFR